MKDLIGNTYDVFCPALYEQKFFFFNIKEDFYHGYQFWHEDRCGNVVFYMEKITGPENMIDSPVLSVGFAQYEKYTNKYNHDAGGSNFIYRITTEQGNVDIHGKITMSSAFFNPDPNHIDFKIVPALIFHGDIK